MKVWVVMRSLATQGRVNVIDVYARKDRAEKFVAAMPQTKNTKYWIEEMNIIA